MGLKFDSRWEAERWGQLKAMERAGVVTQLERQIKYELSINDVKICDYIADAKGIQTPEFRLKKKMMKAIHDIDIYLSFKKK